MGTAQVASAEIICLPESSLVVEIRDNGSQLSSGFQLVRSLGIVTLPQENNRNSVAEYCCWSTSMQLGAMFSPKVTPSQASFQASSAVENVPLLLQPGELQT